MSTSSSPSSPSSSHFPKDVSTTAVAEATERRMHLESPLQTFAQTRAEHDKQLSFRRLLDPGILRPNPHETAMASLKTLLTIAENLLREPDNPKFQRFKPTNSVIKRHLVDPKGALEYAIALGFRSEVVDFQPYYTFNKQKMSDLRMGATILKEFVDLEAMKREQEEKSKKEEKAAAKAAADKVKLAFLDDRRSRTLHDEMEKERREARASIAATQDKELPIDFIPLDEDEDF